MLQCRILTEFLAVARSIELAGSSRAEALSTVAAALAQVGHIAQALEVAHSIEDAFWRGRALSAVAAALAQVGHIAQALEVARSIKYAYWRGKALSAVALVHTDKGEEAGRILTESLEVARCIGDARSRAQALSAVAAALAQAGYIAQALEVARSIEEADRRGRALSAVASALAQADQLWDAFFILQPCNVYDYLRSITKWVLSLEKHKPALSLEIIGEVVRIVGWVWPQWRQAYDILTTSR